MDKFKRDNKPRIVKVDFDQVRNTQRYQILSEPQSIEEGNRISRELWEEERRKREFQHRHAELIRRQREAAAFQRALDAYNKPTLRDWLCAPLRTLKAVWRLKQ